MWRTPGDARRSLDDVPNAGPASVILAIETSCDDTCAAVVSPTARSASNVISSQGVHDRFGGVVPEVAARHHLELVNAVVDDALRTAGATLDDVELVAVTQGPGLVGALLVGVATAKALAAGARPAARRRSTTCRATSPPTSCRPATVRSSRRSCAWSPPAATRSSRASTDHVGFEVLGATLDDAAGEAFDKGARLLGLPFPGGPALERLAARGRPRGVRVPDRRARRRAWTSRSPGSRPRCSTRCATSARSAPRAPRRPRGVLPARDRRGARAPRGARAARRPACGRVAIGGGVAANGPLRERLARLGVELHVPPRELCTDNAAMIASAARWAKPLRRARSGSTPTRAASARCG